MTAMPVTIQERIPLPPSVSARPAAVAAGMTPADVLRILKQRIFLILAIWIFLSAGAVGLTWYLDRNYSSYTAKAFVLVESPHPKTPMSMGLEQGVSSEQMNRYVADEAHKIKDDQVITDAVTDPRIRESDWWKKQTDKVRLLDKFKEELIVQPMTGSSYILVSFETRNPQDAASIVNTVLDKYITKLDADSREAVGKELKDYRDTELKLKAQLTAIQDAKQKFMTEQVNAPGISGNLNIVGEGLRTLSVACIQVENEMLQYKALYNNLSGVDASQIVVSPEMQMMIQQDPVVGNLRQQKQMLEQNKNILLQEYGSNHRMLTGLQNQLDVVDKDLQKAIAAKEKDVRDYQLNTALTHHLNAEQVLMELRERKKEEEDKQRDLDQAYVRFDNLREQEYQVREELSRIQQYNNQLQLVLEESNRVRVSKSNAIRPETKSFPQWALMVPGGSVLGLFLGLGLAFLLELMDTSMRTPRDLARHAHVPILGTVPDLDDEEIPIDRIEMAAHVAPRSMTAESFRTIRTNLLLSSPAERQRTVLVTSAKPEEGKTAIACNLAISIGQSGRRVLLIDANFHRPTLHQVFNRSQKDGLSNALIGQAKLEDLIQTTDLPNLDIIASGPIPPNPTELLTGPYLRELITQAEGRYDQIIFDGPPVLLLSDSLVLAGTLDGVIIVCRAKATSRGAVQRAREQIERVNGRIFGAILNAARVRRGGYFREQIRTYYDYQPEEVLAGQGTRALPNGAKSGGADDETGA